MIFAFFTSRGKRIKLQMLCHEGITHEPGLYDQIWTFLISSPIAESEKVNLLLYYPLRIRWGSPKNEPRSPPGQAAYPAALVP